RDAPDRIEDAAARAAYGRARRGNVRTAVCADAIRLHAGRTAGLGRRPARALRQAREGGAGRWPAAVAQWDHPARIRTMRRLRASHDLPGTYRRFRVCPGPRILGPWRGPRSVS